MKTRNSTLLSTVVLFFISSSQVLAQTTRTVCSSGCNFTTIQAAMTAATSGDTILLNVNGAFTEKNIAIPEKNLVLKGLGKTTTILQSAASRASGSGGRIFSYLAPTGAGNNSFTVLDMTIRYAIAPLTDIAGGGQYQSLGGVLYATAPKGFKVTFDNVKLYANETTAGNVNNSGGACFYVSATGSGYTNNAELTITNCDFDDNKVANSSGTSLSDGPCFDLLGSPGKLKVDKCTFTNNNGYTRGGVSYVGSNWEVSFSNSSFENNTCRNGDGGCFYAASGLSYSFDNCLFSNNTAVYVSPVNGNNGWGGVYRGKAAKFNNCTFYNNSAVKGGAIYRNNSPTNGEMQILNCTFYGNAASGTGSSIHYGNGASTSAFPLTLINSIFTNGGGASTGDIHFALAYSQLTTNIKNYCNSVSTEYSTPGTAPVFAFTSSNTTLGLSSAPALNGGTIKSLALTSASTLIDAGTNTSGATYDIAVKDQRDYSRQDGAIDVGSYEYSGLTDDAVKPEISFTAPGNALTTGDRTITATISDANGVYWYQQNTDQRPRIYFRKNGGSWNSAAGTLSSGDGINGTWQFTIASAAMGGLAFGDQVSYYIIVQDVSTNANIISSPANAVASSVNSVSAAPVPQSYIIGSVVPVKLTGFVAKTNGVNALLNWTAGNTATITQFIVQRSSNGSNWNDIGTVPVTISTQYSFTDAALAEGSYYYRLKINDEDGRSTYSELKMIKMQRSNAIFSLKGNQVSNGTLLVTIHRKTALAFFDTNGQLLWTKNLLPGMQQIDVSNFAKGLYFLRADGLTKQIRLQ